MVLLTIQSRLARFNLIRFSLVRFSLAQLNLTRLSRRWLRVVAIAFTAITFLSACGGSGSPSVETANSAESASNTGNSTADNSGDNASTNNEPREPKTFVIVPGDAPDGEDAALAAFFLAQEGDTIQFEEGTFDLSTTLVMAHKNGITIRGRGQDKTVLSFQESSAPEGISMSHMDGVLIEELTIVDTPGFSVKISDSNHVVLKNMRAMWTSGDNGQDVNEPSSLDVSCDYAASAAESTGFYTVGGVSRPYTIDSTNGGYAIYPVKSNNVMLDNVTALGASDAGIYVGQSNDVIVKNSLARFNVAGYEIENTDRADMFDNLADCNTGGFLIFDLPGLSQYGDKTRTFNNVSVYNNLPNFAPGGVVSAVPQGTGMLVLGYDEMEFFSNEINNNRTGGIIIAGHELLAGGCVTKNKKDANGDNVLDENGDPVQIPCEGDLKMDLYPEAWHIRNNNFANNGYAPQLPEDGALICADGTGPGLDSTIPCVPTGVDDGHDSLLPALVLLKGTQAGMPTGAHIIWDGYFDKEPFARNNAPEAPNDCPYPEGVEADEKAKPQYRTNDSTPCRYNGNKFERDANGEYIKDADDNFVRKNPTYWGCIDTNNTFDALTPAFMNFKGVDPTTPADYDITTHDCVARFGATLASLPEAVVEEYVPEVSGDAAPSDEEVLAACENFAGNQINRDALAFNCPKLSHYNLFQSAADPRVDPNEGGLEYDLTTPLFSDYAKKYRFVFLPPNESAQWVEGTIGTPNDGLRFPVGTVIAKTFTFIDGNNENVVETRLLIHRQGDGVEQSDSSNFWEGFSYIWEKDANGNLIDANLAISGGTAAVSWNFTDEFSNQNVSGNTDNYSIPHPNQCGTCHSNDDRPGGDAPIGPKVRLLNRQVNYDGIASNQLQRWIDAGKLTGAPTLTINNENIATNVLRLPNFQIPNDFANIPVPSVDTGEDPKQQQPGDTKFDVEIRARAWLETNCAHCHNKKGIASSTGLFLDVFRKIDINYGVCKTPTTAGSSSGGNNEDIRPGDAGASILSFRMHSEDSSAQMPPIARSVNHDEAIELIDAWINDVVDGSYEGAGCEASPI